jgi:hypothetical protein
MLLVAMVEAHMAGFAAQRHCVPSGEPPPPPRAPIANRNPAIGRDATLRAPYTRHPSPPRADATGVTNSGEPEPPLPYSSITAVTLVHRHPPLSPSLSLSGELGVERRRRYRQLPSVSLPLSLSLSLFQ